MQARSSSPASMPIPSATPRKSSSSFYLDCCARVTAGSWTRGTKVFAEVFGPPPRLVVVGAVDTAEELCPRRGRSGRRTAVADARARFATHERLPSADEIVVGWPDDAFAKLDLAYGDAVVVLTHDDKFDRPRSPAPSARTSRTSALSGRGARSRRGGAAPRGGRPRRRQLGRVHGPCGLDIGAESPAETAVSILAEILAVRAGRGGGHLRTSSRRIHAEREPDGTKMHAQ